MQFQTQHKNIEKDTCTFAPDWARTTNLTAKQANPLRHRSQVLHINRYFRCSIHEKVYIIQ